ncbi:uncharacterized protein A1O5_10964 [Cladophialophora psammophila CBS 110553]|uniref:Peptidase S8/S53 domain-containing protein n=1 Tax=Cladophialophora psammophila CBS 110553 TaxID=1182543 RepID=W9WCZ5_9EURO|nr:uncharacterized protein A1O5_10964 [Cladophialophora psammophila CBS 110553]EXJ65987.1 hypothetical protein A1O5_10964 [Cladophialophora psammophila CBS 110553]
MISFESKDCGGIAPNARLCVQGGIFKAKSPQAPELFDRINQLPDLNCRIHNNSWGTTWNDEQKAQAELGKIKFPQFPYTIYNAEPVDRYAPERPDFFILFAAGNEGGKATDTGAQVTACAAAKNVLTVEATFSNRPMSIGWHVDYTPENEKLFKQKDPEAYRQGTIVPFSSRGPCKNTQRSKPNVLAPGGAILSTRSKDFDSKRLDETLQGASLPPGGQLGNQNIFMSGTSMATPAVSGYAALLREALDSWQSIKQPTAPLMKALLINGSNVLPDTPRNVQGFGEIDMTKVLRPVKPQIANITGGKAASGWTQDVVSKNKSTRLKVMRAVALQAISTLVYHDRPGNQIQNRMNLYVARAGNRINTAPTTQYENVH